MFFFVFQTSSPLFVFLWMYLIWKFIIISREMTLVEKGEMCVTLACSLMEWLLFCYAIFASRPRDHHVYLGPTKVGAFVSLVCFVVVVVMQWQFIYHNNSLYQTCSILSSSLSWNVLSLSHGMVPTLRFIHMVCIVLV